MITERRRQKIHQVMAKRQKKLVIVLEDIYDPHNAAAIFRSADGFGVQNVYLIFDQQKPFNPKEIGKSSSSSANKWLDFHVYQKAIADKGLPLSTNPTEKCLFDLKNQGYKIVATVLDEKATNLYKFIWPEKIALLFGNEHSGLSETARKMADHLVYLPMQGMVQSLNVSVTAGIFLAFVSQAQRINRG
jgi:tRNA (guanosine-2'-O-)-methyltransferase